MEFTIEERQALIDLIRESLEYYHETLRDDHKTVAAAMAVFDVTPTVTVLAKLDPDGHRQLRACVEECVKEYLPD